MINTTELHFEGALNEHFPFGLAAGVGGYKQLTPDGGSGDMVGAFRGRVAAIGPLLSYMAAPSDPPDTGNVEDIALYLKLKAFRAAKATEYTALRTFLNAGPRLRGPTVNFQEWVTARDQFHAAMEASVQALEAFVAHEEAKQRPSQ
jgi:hypothetical protein